MLGLLLAQALLSYDICLSGVMQALRLRFDQTSMLFVVLCVVIVDAFFAVMQGRTPFCTVASVLLLLALWGRSLLYEARRRSLRAAGNMEEPVAAAIGAGIDITQPEGHMIIDIGGGTSDIAVISLSGVVESSSIKIAGDQFNEAVVKYMRRKHNLLVGERTAEQMKMQIGCVFPPEEEMTMEVKGRSLITGLPELISVSSAEMLEAFEEPVERIMEEVHLVLEKTPPELVADISNNGIVMTGGGSLVRGFDKLVPARTGIHAMVAENAIQCVAEGTGKSLDSIQDMQDGTMNLSRRKQIN